MALTARREVSFFLLQGRAGEIRYGLKSTQDWHVAGEYTVLGIEDKS